MSTQQTVDYETDTKVLILFSFPQRVSICRDHHQIVETEKQNWVLTPHCQFNNEAIFVLMAHKNACNTRDKIGC